MQSRFLVGALLFGPLAVAIAIACGGAYAEDEDGLPLGDAGGQPYDGPQGADALTQIVPDGASDAEAGSPSCKTASHTFCDDFDDAPLGAIWTQTQFAFLGSARIEDASAISPPNALAIVTNADAGGAETFLKHRLAGPFGHVVAEADIRVEEKPTSMTVPTIALFEIAIIDATGTNWHLRLHEYAQKTEILEAHFGYADGGSGYDFRPVGTANELFPANEWRHVRLEVTVRADVARATVTVGNTKVFDGDLRQVWKPGAVEIFAGAYSLVWGGGADWKVRIDNVTLDAN